MARIPNVATDEAGGPPADTVRLPRALTAREPAGPFAGMVRAWPTWPLAALGVVAVVTWLLASWNDHARLHRQRNEARWARVPAAANADAPATQSADGAVVR